MAETPDVRPHQVWADNDPRAKGRTVEVLAVANGLALCKVITDVDPNLYQPKKSRVGRTTRISVRRFRPNSTGYRLVQDVSA